MKFLQKMIAFLLALFLVLPCIPAPSYAAEETLPPETQTEETQTVGTLPAETQPALYAVTDGNVGTGTPDGTPPVLKGVTLSADTVTIPGSIEITVDATDDVSGMNYAWVGFYCEKTGKSLSTDLRSTYWDEETHEYRPYPDGLFHGTILIDQYVESGTFVIRYLDLMDVAGNGISYYQNSDDYPIPEDFRSLQFTVIESDTPDGNPPVLNSVSLSATEVTAPGSLEITVDATDDVSGMSYAWVGFYCENTGKSLSTDLRSTYWDEETHEYRPYPDGLFHGTILIDQYVKSGTFVIRYLDLMDVAGNGISYYQNSDDHPIPEDFRYLQFAVIQSDTPDGNPPVLNGLSISATEVTAPGTLEITVDATDDVSGMNYCYVGFYCEATGKTLSTSARSTYWDSESAEHRPYPDGLLHGTLEIDQYVETGTFELNYVDLYDVAGNYIGYYQDSDSHPIPDAAKKLSFHIFNTVPDVTTSLANPGFLDSVKNADSDAYIAADYSGDATMPKEAFEVIAGTDKTIDLISDGITWRFEGSDITEEIKDIDLHVDIQKVAEDSSESGEAIGETLKDNPGVVMKFPENGTLPGKATIQMKVDHTLREYLGSETGLCVYYYNNQTGELELVAQDLKVINDTYVEFEITHCSYYVLTTFKPETQPKSVPMYRMYDPNSGEHFYTGSEDERDGLIKEGWNYEGVGFNFPVVGPPVYRLYQRSTGEHLYTMDMEERAKLLSQGWEDEKVAFNSAPETAVPQYRLHNPNATRGAYHFTGSEEERDNLINAGWEYQGIGWYSCLY